MEVGPEKIFPVDTLNSQPGVGRWVWQDGLAARNKKYQAGLDVMMAGDGWGGENRGQTQTQNASSVELGGARMPQGFEVRSGALWQPWAWRPLAGLCLTPKALGNRRMELNWISQSGTYKKWLQEMEGKSLHTWLPVTEIK